MGKLFGFLVWLFSFWTWKGFFLRWLRRPSSHPASGETAGHLLSKNGQHQSRFARFLSSLHGEERRCRCLYFDGYSKVIICFGFYERLELTVFHGTCEQVPFGEFLDAVASSEVEFCEEVSLLLRGDDSCNHVEAFAWALRKSRNGFRKLALECQVGPAIRFAKCVSNILLGNDAIQDLCLSFYRLKEDMDKELTAEFMAIIAVPRNLRVLKYFRIWTRLDEEGTKQLLEPLQNRFSALESLRFRSLTSDVQLEHISAMLASSTTLKTLGIHTASSAGEFSFTRGYDNIATALCSNQSLKSLSCEISTCSELKVLLGPLICRNNNLQQNSTLTKLQLHKSIGGKEGIQTIVELIHTNTSLTELCLNRVEDLSIHDAQGVENALIILEALKRNKYLKKVGFEGCEAIGGYKVLGAMMDLLLENHSIQDIGLDGTQLSASGDGDYVSSTLSKRKKMKLWSVVQSMTSVNPTSGRVFLCGQPLAGKTRLRMSMKQLEEFQQNDQTPNRFQIRGKIRNVFKTLQPPKGTTKNKSLERTHGIEVESVQCDGIGITIWDMAGQTDYHSFHELVMPNLSADGSSSLFLLVCNPMQQLNLSKRRSPSDIKLELEAWLRFIASNTRRSLSYCPHVSIVMTHFDYWMDDHSFSKCIDNVVGKLKSQFIDVLEFDEDKIVFKVDGWDESHAREVFDFMKSYMKQLLVRLPKTIKACDDVQRLVALWNKDKSKPFLLKWEEFCEGMCMEVKELNDVNYELSKRKREFVAVSLNDGGHIIYNEKEQVVITNPHWFCHQIVGQFLHQCTIVDSELEMVSSNGIVSMEYMKSLISKLMGGEGDMEKQFEDILGMMIKLHICYEQDSNSIMIPSALQDKYKSLSWSTNVKSQNMNYIGRRLACQDGIQTMLTPGFFTRLQLQIKNDQETYHLFRDIINFISDGIDVIIQFYQGDIDILLRSHQCEDKMFEFLESRIIMHIKHLQEDPILGCPGVRLIEYILRPACVERLIHAKNRKNQCVPIKDLEAKVIIGGIDATHNWQSCEDLGIDFDKVSTLLGGMAWKNLLQKRSCNLLYYYKKIQSFGAIIQDDQSNSNDAKSGLWTSTWQMPWKLLYGPLDEKLDNMRRENYEYHKETMSKLDDVVHLIQNLEKNIQNMQGQLLREVCSKINDLMVLTSEMQKSQIPKLAYLCEFGKKQLLTRLVPNLDRIQLHLMCESIYGFHEVPNQKGCPVYFGSEHTKRFFTMVAWGLKIATILTKIGAHVACGMASMVPDFSEGASFATLIINSSSFLDYEIPIATIQSLPCDVRKDLKISMEDQCEAQRWLQEFLEPKCQNKRDFYKQFGLKKVCYTRVRGSIAWICDRCISLHRNDIDELK